MYPLAPQSLLIPPLRTLQDGGTRIREDLPSHGDRVYVCVDLSQDRRKVLTRSWTVIPDDALPRERRSICRPVDDPKDAPNARGEIKKDRAVSRPNRVVVRTHLESGFVPNQGF